MREYPQPCDPNEVSCQFVDGGTYQPIYGNLPPYVPNVIIPTSGGGVGVNLPCQNGYVSVLQTDGSFICVPDSGGVIGSITPVHGAVTPSGVPVALGGNAVAGVSDLITNVKNMISAHPVAILIAVGGIGYLLFKK